MATKDSDNLKAFRPYLMVLARLHLDGWLRGKVDPADLVQQTTLRAMAAGLRDQGTAVLTAWLRRIPARVPADPLRQHDADKRAVELERSLEADLDLNLPRMVDPKLRE